MTTQERLNEHFKESLTHFSKNQIVGIFLQGSQNYKLDLPTSDIDSKLIVVPSFRDIALNAKPISTTFIRENEEHIDEKDIRLYFQTFRKGNPNFLEILFTPYFVINPLYAKPWNKLVSKREKIARLNPYRAIQAMKGVVLEKQHAMEHPYPSKIKILEKYSYDAKQLHHLIRMDEFQERYINGEKYADCLIPLDHEHLLQVKQNLYDLETARQVANETVERVLERTEKYCSTHENEENEETIKFLEDILYEVMKIAIKKEFENK